MYSYNYDSNVSNAFVAFSIGSVYAAGIISPEATTKYMRIIEEFKPRNNLFVMPGDYDDRFGETLTNLYRSLYLKEVEEYCKNKNINYDVRFVNLSDEDKSLLSAKALNCYIDKVTHGNELRLTDIAKCDIANDIYKGRIMGNRNAELLLTEQVKKHLALTDEQMEI